MFKPDHPISSINDDLLQSTIDARGGRGLEAPIADWWYPDDWEVSVGDAKSKFGASVLEKGMKDEVLTLWNPDTQGDPKNDFFKYGELEAFENYLIFEQGQLDPKSIGDLDVEFM